MTDRQSTHAPDCWGWGPKHYDCAAREIERLAAQLTAAQQRPVEDGCHCATCTCNPNMTPAVRFDLSPVQTEGAIREHLIRLGWTPPAAEPKTLPVPTRVYLIDKAAVIAGHPQRGWDDDGPDAHNCDDMGCSTFGRHVLASVPFTDERDVAQQPAAVDEAMVERACKAALDEVWPDTYEEADDLRAMIRRILTAALATQHQEPTT